MKTIWKFKLKTTDIQQIEVPYEAKALTVQLQNEDPFIWYLVDDDKYLTSRQIKIIGIGNSIEDDFKGSYVGTYQLFRGAVVFHVFELPE